MVVGQLLYLSPSFLGVDEDHFHVQFYVEESSVDLSSCQYVQQQQLQHWRRQQQQQMMSVSIDLLRIYWKLNVFTSKWASGWPVGFPLGNQL